MKWGEGLDIWQELEIEPCVDVKAIRRAYAKKSKKIHPEESPEEFLRLKSAYETAISLAKEGKNAISPSEQEKLRAVIPCQGGTLFQDLECNYRDTQAFLHFCQLYYGDKEESTLVWLEYFTSDAFLEVYLEEGFQKEVFSTFQQEFPVIYPVFLRLYFMVYQLPSLPAYENTDLADCDFYYPGKSLKYVQKLWVVANNAFNLQFTATEIAFGCGFRDYYLLLNRNSPPEDMDLCPVNILELYLSPNLFHQVPNSLEEQDDFCPRLVCSTKLIANFLQNKPVSLEISEKIAQTLYHHTPEKNHTWEKYKHILQALEGNFPSIFVTNQDDWTQLEAEMQDLLQKARNPQRQGHNSQFRYFFKNLGFRQIQCLFHPDCIILLEKFLISQDNPLFLSQFTRFYEKHDLRFRSQEPQLQGLLEKIHRRIQELQTSQEQNSFQFSPTAPDAFYRYLVSCVSPEISAKIKENCPIPPVWLEKNFPNERTVHQENLNFRSYSLRILYYSDNIRYFHQNEEIFPGFFSISQILQENPRIFWRLLPLCQDYPRDMPQPLCTLFQEGNHLNFTPEWLNIFNISENFTENSDNSPNFPEKTATIFSVDPVHGEGSRIYFQGFLGNQRTLFHESQLPFPPNRSSEILGFWAQFWRNTSNQPMNTPISLRYSLTSPQIPLKINEFQEKSHLSPLDSLFTFLEFNSNYMELTWAHCSLTISRKQHFYACFLLDIEENISYFLNKQYLWEEEGKASLFKKKKPNSQFILEEYDFVKYIFLQIYQFCSAKENELGDIHGESLEE